ncbi:hypothetical protein [Legionella hackeliae]|uniref:Ankyrin repeat protein n=1 Tax=Legionella hackeliae TaxID=449 RepID=A0A0A8USC6_LEGHA|nr:hypothetical protein [Legionella hackeliae]KTD10155.1 DNA repair protein [Legionella hackeliae]CEK09649.1 protein of unknown function [Legionella hackeliae]STX49560.1 DNA repair protein [Legionella hackeliae]
MWYLKLLAPLLENVKAEDRHKAQEFLVKLFNTLKSEIYSKEHSIPVGVLVSVIERTYAKFENKGPSSLSLTEFSNFFFLRTLVYVKSQDEYAIWNSDLVYITLQLKHYLGWTKEISDLTTEFQTGKKTIKTKTLFSNETKAVLYLLNKLERELLQEPDFNLNDNFFHMEIIFRKYADKEVLKAFTNECSGLTPDSPEFYEMIGFLNLPRLIETMESTAIQIESFQYADKAESLRALARNLQKKNEELKQLFAQQPIDATLIVELKKSIKATLKEVRTIFGSDLQAMRIFHKNLTPQSSLFSEQAEEISKQLEQAFLQDKFTLGLQKLKEFSTTLSPIMAQKFLKLANEQMKVRRDNFYQLERKSDDYSFEPFLKELESLLLQYGFEKTILSFRDFFKESPLFAPLVTIINQRMVEIEGLSKELEHLQKFVNEVTDSPAKVAFLHLLNACKSELKTICFEANFSAAKSKFQAKLNDGVTTILLKNSSLATMREFMKAFGEETSYPSLKQEISQKLKEFNEHPVKLLFDYLRLFIATVPNQDCFNKLIVSQQAYWDMDFSQYPGENVEVEFGKQLCEKLDNALLDSNSFELLERVTTFYSSSELKTPALQLLEPLISRNQLRLERFKSHNLTDGLTKMEEFGKSITSDKKQGVEQLVAELREQWRSLFVELEKPVPEQGRLKAMVAKFRQTLHSKDEEMNTHREAWKPIVANIFLALTGIGAVAIALKTLHSVVTKPELSINSCLFFAKTASQNTIEAFDEKINKIMGA